LGLCAQGNGKTKGKTSEQCDGVTVVRRQVGKSVDGNNIASTQSRVGHVVLIVEFTRGSARATNAFVLGSNAQRSPLYVHGLFN